METMNVFISQPMKNRPNDEILEERRQLMEYVQKLYPDRQVKELNSFFASDIQSRNAPLKMLGMSLELLAEADVAIFANYWSLARGCKIEHRCCETYNVPIIDLGD